jgi:uncharacterized Zn-finger protein
MSDLSTDHAIIASQKRHYVVTAADLPLCCPMPGMRLWDSHPRVYLPIEEKGEVLCPYCGASYTLEGGDSSSETSKDIGSADTVSGV